MRRARNAKIVATLGPASSDKETVGRLFLAGADVFRICSPTFTCGSPMLSAIRISCAWWPTLSRGPT
jgi:hypothetical protein